MKVLLINPSWGGRMRAQRYNRCWPPLDLLTIASRLRSAGDEVVLLDARARPVEAGELARWADGIILTTSPLDRWQCPNLDLTPLWRWTSTLPKEKLILTGAHGTLFPESLLKATGARALVRGEPEVAAAACCHALACGAFADAPAISFWDGAAFQHTPTAPPIELSRLPLPAYDLTRAEDYEYELLGRRMAVLETSRGCPHRCAFCLKVMYGPGVRTKPVDQVACEVEEVVRRGYRCVYFIDLEFSLDRERTVALCRMLKPFGLRWCCQTRVDAVDAELLEEMAEAGCRLIHFGIESGEGEARLQARKRISVRDMEAAVRGAKAAGMATAGFFLIGFPWEGPRARAKTEALARRLNLTYVSFHTVTPYPQTALGSSIERPWWEEGLPESPRLTGMLLRYVLRPAYWMEFLRHGSNRLATLGLFADALRAPKGEP